MKLRIYRTSCVALVAMLATSAMAFAQTSNQVIWTTVNNSARFGTRDAQINAQYGQVTGAANPRIGQLGLRFVF
jgi:hypothetical protein